MKLHEIFYSIQGEGCHTGEAAIFIRFSGCNLNCSWCDTNHSCKMEATPQRICQQVDQYPKGAMVVLTGGEPMLQPELAHLLDCLLIRNRFIAMETNGTIYNEQVVQDLDWITVSPKQNHMLPLIPYNDICELKYIMTDDLTLADIPTKKAFSRFIYLQPLSQDEASAMRCIDWVQKFPDRFRLSIQVHKYLNLR